MTELWINLAREEEVEMILKKLSNLKILNGLPVDRSELEIEDDDELDSIPK